MRKLTLALSTLMLLLFPGQAFAKHSIGNSNSSHPGWTLTNLADWNLPAEYYPVDRIQIRIFQTTEYTYHIEFSYGSVVQSIRAVPPMAEDLGLRIKDVVVLDDQNLATIWKTAIGDMWHMKVFTYTNDGVAEVLQTTSIYRPEFLYVPGTAYAKQVSIFTASKTKPIKTLDTKRLIQGIIVTQAERKDDKWIPTNSEIYSWDSVLKKYATRGKQPWKNRLAE